MKNIETLNSDIQSVNAIRDFRASIGSTQRVVNPYNWWQASLVMLTYEDMSLPEAMNSLFVTTGMEYPASVVTLLIKAINGKAPHKVKRDYSKSLPTIVELTGLNYYTGESVGVGRRPTVFSFKDKRRARNILLTNFPELMPLFVELDRVFRNME